MPVTRELSSSNCGSNKFMPFYDFECKSCKEVFTELCSWEDRNNMVCKTCGGEVSKPVTTPAGHRCYGEGYYAPSLKMNL